MALDGCDDAFNLIGPLGPIEMVNWSLGNDSWYRLSYSCCIAERFYCVTRIQGHPDVSATYFPCPFLPVIHPEGILAADHLSERHSKARTCLNLSDSHNI